MTTNEIALTAANEGQEKRACEIIDGTRLFTNQANISSTLCHRMLRCCLQRKNLKENVALVPSLAIHPFG